MKRIKSNRLASQSGTTLIELSVVIAVILLLASVLFLGVQGWRNAANQSAAIVDISSIQKAVRGFQNINLLNAAAPAVGTSGQTGYVPPVTGGACDSQTDIAPFFGGNLPKDPSNNNGNFTYGTAIPAYGALYATSGNTATTAQATTMATANNW